MAGNEPHKTNTDDGGQRVSRDIAEGIAAGPTAQYFREKYSTGGALVNLKNLSTADLAAALNNLVESIKEGTTLNDEKYSHEQILGPFDNGFSTFVAILKTGADKGIGRENPSKSLVQEMIELDMLQDLAMNNDLSYQASSFDSAADALGLDYEFATFGAQPAEQTPKYDTQVETLSSVFETAGGFGSKSEELLLHSLNETGGGLDYKDPQAHSEYSEAADVFGVEKVTFGSAAGQEEETLTFDAPHPADMEREAEIRNDLTNYIDQLKSSGVDVTTMKDMCDYLGLEGQEAQKYKPLIEETLTEADIKIEDTYAPSLDNELDNTENTPESEPARSPSQDEQPTVVAQLIQQPGMNI